MLCVAIREIFGSDIFINFIVRKITWNSENGLIWKVFKPKKVFRNKFILYYYKKNHIPRKKKLKRIKIYNKNIQVIKIIISIKGYIQNMNFVLHVVIDRPERTSNRNFLMQFFSTEQY